MDSEGKDLLTAAMAQVETHPETWEQGSWRCDSGFCLAGHMVELCQYATWAHPDGMSWELSEVLDTDSGAVYMNPQEWIVERFGLGNSDATRLFYEHNRLEHLRTGVKAVLNDERVGTPYP